MSYKVCENCNPPFYAKTWKEVEEHEKETGHTFFDESPEWTI